MRLAPSCDVTAEGAPERLADFSIFSMAVDLYASILNSFLATFINQTWVSDGFAKPLHASV